MSDAQDSGGSIKVGPEDHVIVVRADGTVEARVRIAEDRAIEEPGLFAIGMYLLSQDDTARRKVALRAAEHVTNAIKEEAEWRGRFKKDNRTSD